MSFRSDASRGVPSRRTRRWWVAISFGLCIASVMGHGAGRTVGAQPGQPVESVRYSPPTSAEVIDSFRPPETPYGSGNRGLEYATVPGSPIIAGADGVVTFAGSIGEPFYVTIYHVDGVSTTYSFLTEVAVASGDYVSGGQHVGTASSRFHFGAKRGEVYLDPAILLEASSGASANRAVLVAPSGGG